MHFCVKCTSWSQYNVLQDGNYMMSTFRKKRKVCMNQSIKIISFLGSEQVEQDQAMPEEPQSEPQVESGSSSDLKTTVIEESSSTIEVSEKNTSKVEESKITIEQKVIVAEQSTERVVTLTEEASTHFSSGK